MVRLWSEEAVMSTNNIGEPLQVGARVKILNSGYEPGLIVEFRGPLGPGKAARTSATRAASAIARNAGAVVAESACVLASPA